MGKLRSVRLSHRAGTALAAIDERSKEQLKDAIREVWANPLSGRKLKIDSDELRSYRVGSFRIIYRVTGGVVEVAWLDQREDVFR